MTDWPMLIYDNCRLLVLLVNNFVPLISYVCITDKLYLNTCMTNWITLCGAMLHSCGKLWSYHLLGCDTVEFLHHFEELIIWWMGIL